MEYLLKFKRFVLVTLILLISFVTLVLFVMGNLAKMVGIYNDILVGRYTHPEYFPQKLESGHITPFQFPYVAANPLKERFFEQYIIGDFEFFMPVKHPLYYTYPLFRGGADVKEIKFGIEIRNVEDEILLSLIEQEPLKFESIIDSNKLFSLPIFKKFLQNIPESEYWRDLFSLKVEPLQINLFESPISSIRKIKDLNYKELVYRLYILALRTKYFPAYINSFGNPMKSQFMIISYINNQKMTYELWYLYQGIIKRFKVEEINKKDGSLELFSNFLNGKLVTEEVDPEKSNYRRFQGLSIAERGTIRGVLALLSIIPKSKQKSKLIEEMVYYLERNPKEEKLTKHVFQELLKAYGTNFSNKEINIEEAPEKYLDRKIDEEERRDRERLLKEEVKVPVMENNIDYHIQKAKDDKVNLDDLELRDVN